MRHDIGQRLLVNYFYEFSATENGKEPAICGLSKREFIVRLLDNVVSENLSGAAERSRESCRACPEGMFAESLDGRSFKP